MRPENTSALLWMLFAILLGFLPTYLLFMWLHGWNEMDEDTYIRATSAIGVGAALHWMIILVLFG